ncbi:MAG: GDP-mannose 4,6-dehydratase [Candidatus Omnitrophica bacterium]|nr:GDP-mannose 4,6-dehydratase [Candidatus Omnitrophota bacterium]
MKILLTGGAGFVGSHLAESLLNDGHELTVVDNLITGSKENIKHLEDKAEFRFIEGSILDYKLMLKLVTECECIYHLAAAVGVKFVIDNPLDSLITNVRGTEIIFELAHIFHKKVFFASSSEVYGKDADVPFSEDDDRIMGSVSKSRWGYAFSKGFDEFLAIAYAQEKKLPIVIGRLFNICGPRQSHNYGMVIPRFVEQALKNQPITVYGDGQQIRSFTYIDNVVKAIKSLMDNPQAYGQIFNIGNSNFISIGEIAQKIKQLCHSNSEITYIPYSQVYGENFEDMFYRVPDTSKIEKLTGFNPSIDLDEMLKIIINYHRGS